VRVARNQEKGATHEVERKETVRVLRSSELVMKRMTQQQIDEWNETFPVGSPCWVRYDDGSEHTHHTRSKAYECPCFNKGHVVVKVDGLSYSVDLDRIHMAETHAA